MYTFEKKSNNYDFWSEWSDITEIEQRAIESVQKARELIINSVPAETLVAIYIKGSFVRREMKQGSDIDIVPIVNDDKYQKDIFLINTQNIDPAIVVPLSLSEFKNNKLHTKSEFQPDLRAKPDRLLKKLDQCRLIYGDPLTIEDYPIRTDPEVLRDEINTMQKGYIPLYQKGKIFFEPLLKEVFWLTEVELNIAGIEVQHSFFDIANAVKDPSHIIHEAYQFRKNTKREGQAEFIENLLNYLKKYEQTK
ncbi:MAG: hypothetical protein CO073_03685 [Candidatus Komeilibacteria bacterium CG_4_9_14_0_8_um_filter_36_9]|uniref:Polymerase nucleotidyl transferase domain-containing protein n=1 Tax=Candidatus Komeilibacteria bacterium CG_4_9_14_0_8_um_filter_36_9 TaxID=1974473 RepID=A0A2M8DQG6_9BACT|nr:MAG: hypothetical protein CO073_03685 [Candidatus Komeilibacteria bacterium CG_4_9_14_0_8_um_filter_36_9]